MKKISVLLFSIFFYCTVNAQVSAIYFYGDQITKDKEKATSYAVFGKLSTDSLYVLKLYDLDDNLLQTGFYKDEELKIPHGKFLIYKSVEDFNYDNETNFYIKNKDRFLFEQGEYKDGKKIGRWIQFFPDEKIFSITTYLEGYRHGEYKVYNRRGKLTTVGHYKLDLKDGIWLNNEGKKEIFNNGVLQ